MSGIDLKWITFDTRQWTDVFQHFSAETTKMEPALRSTQVLKQEAEDKGLMGKGVAKYVTRQKTLERGEREAWRDIQKMQAQADIELAKIRAEAEV